MKIMIIGGTGIIGTGLVNSAAERGHKVYAICRHIPESNQYDNVSYVRCDWRNDKEANELIDKFKVDIIIDGLVFGVSQLKRDLKIVERIGCERFIYISSVAVYTLPALNVKEEEASSKHKLKWSYGYNKKAVEDYLWKHKSEYDFEMTVVRPSFTYGDTRIPCAVVDRKNQWAIMKRIESSKPLLFFDDKDALHAITHISIFSNAVIDICENSDAAGRTFHFGDEQSYTWDDVIEAAASHIERQPKIIYVPLKYVKKYNYQLYIETRENKYGTLTVDTTNTRQISSNSPRHVELKDGLKSTIDNLRAVLKDKSSEEFDDFCDLVFLDNFKELKNDLDEYEYACLEEYICSLSDEEKKRIYNKRSYYLRKSYIYRTKELVKGILKVFNYYG